jgi:hypothetical protein
LFKIIFLLSIVFFLGNPLVYASPTSDYNAGYDKGYDGGRPKEPLNDDYMKGWDKGKKDGDAGNERQPPKKEPGEKGRPTEPLPTPPTPLPPITGKQPDVGDPLCFKNCIVERHYNPATTEYFDLWTEGKLLPMSRTITEGATMFIDRNHDGKLTNGQEWLFSDDVYNELKRLDTDQNGYFDYNDEFWSYVMIKEDGVYSKPTDIIGFKWQDSKYYQDDIYGIGVYADAMCEGVKCNAEQSNYQYFEPISDEHFRITCSNDEGVLYVGGSIEPSYCLVMGYLN